MKPYNFCHFFRGSTKNSLLNDGILDDPLTFNENVHQGPYKLGPLLVSTKVPGHRRGEKNPMENPCVNATCRSYILYPWSHPIYSKTLGFSLKVNGIASPFDRKNTRVVIHMERVAPHFDSHFDAPSATRHCMPSHLRPSAPGNFEGEEFDGFSSLVEIR